MLDIYKPSVKYYLPSLLLGLTSVNKNVGWMIPSAWNPFWDFEANELSCKFLVLWFHKVIVLLFVTQEFFVFPFHMISTKSSDDVGITKILKYIDLFNTT